MESVCNRNMLFIGDVRYQGCPLLGGLFWTVFVIGRCSLLGVSNFKWFLLLRGARYKEVSVIRRCPFL